MKKFFSIIIYFLIFNCIQVSANVHKSYNFVYNLEGKYTNEVSVTISDLNCKDNNEYTLSMEDDEKRPIEIQSEILSESKDDENIIIMDFKADNENNPYPEIETMTVTVSCSVPSGGWRLLGKDYRLLCFSGDVVEDLSDKIADSNKNEVIFTVNKLGKYVIYLNPGVYDLVFYADEPIPTEDGNILPEIYYEIEGLRQEDIVIFPEIPQKEGYVFTGWKAWIGSGIYHINAQPIYGNEYRNYYASWCLEDEYEPIEIEISSAESITKGKEDGKKITLKTNYGVFVGDDDFPTDWRTAYDSETDEQTKADILSEWKSKWNIVGSDDLLIETATRIDDKTIEFTLSGNSNDKYSNADIYIEFNNSLLLPEPYELDGEIVDWDDTKIQMDEDGVRRKMYISDNAIALNAQRRSGGGMGGGSTAVSSYTVSFNTNGGSEIAKATVKKNEAVTEPAAPVKDGYIFAGWFADEEFTEEYDFTSKAAKNITLYAKWEEAEADEANNQIIFTVGERKAVVFGEAKTNDVAPVIRKDRTFLPARFVAESLGAKVEWDNASETVTITKDDIKIVIIIGAETAKVNGEEETLEAPAFLENDRTYTPIRFIAEKLGAEVEWEEEKKLITINK